MIALLLALALAQSPRTIADVRVHGNHSTPDATVLQLAGIKPGDPAPADLAAAVAGRLKKSGRFDRVDVIERSRSLDGSQLAIVILLEEKLIVPIDVPVPGAGAVVNTVRRVTNRPMFLPIVDFTDYGFSYGLRASYVNALGRGSRVSVPFTWGAQKRIAGEYEHRFGPARKFRVDAAASWMRRENPFYAIDDTRKEVAGGLAYQASRPLRLTARTGLTAVSFADTDETFPWVSGEAVFDTRLDPDLPREAVYAGLRVERLNFDRFEPATRVRTDLRGYLGLIGQSILAVRALHVMSDSPLPPFERVLLGGASTLRGSEFGFAAGDNVAAGSIELRLPVSSPLSSFARVGFNLFADVGAAYDRGTKMRHAGYRWGYGAGAWFSATVFKLNLDLAANRDGDVKVHVASGFRF